MAPRGGRRHIAYAGHPPSTPPPPPPPPPSGTGPGTIPDPAGLSLGGSDPGRSNVWFEDFSAFSRANYTIYSGGASGAHPTQSWWDSSHLITRPIVVAGASRTILSIESYVDNAVGPGDGRVVSGGFSCGALASSWPAYTTLLVCFRGDQATYVNKVLMDYGTGTTPAGINAGWPWEGENDWNESEQGAQSQTVHLHKTNTYPATNHLSTGAKDANNDADNTQTVGSLNGDQTVWSIAGTRYKQGAGGPGTVDIEFLTNDGDGTTNLRVWATVINANGAFARANRRFIAQVEGAKLPVSITGTKRLDLAWFCCRA